MHKVHPEKAKAILQENLTKCEIELKPWGKKLEQIVFNSIKAEKNNIHNFASKDNERFT